MKRKIYTLLAFAGIFSAGSAIAQKQNVGIGTITPDQSAVLEIQSADKGLLIPRLSKDQMYSIKTPATGLMVYQTGEKSGFYFYDGKNWNPINGSGTESANSVAGDPFDWTLNGSAPTPTQFLGTTNSEPLRFKLNNQWAGRLEFSGATANNFLGRNVGQSATGINNTAFGFRSLSGTFTGNENTAMGSLTMLSTTIGSSNVGIGYGALQNNTTGNNNMALGGRALISNIDGFDNTAVGNYALFSNQSGDYNVAVGSVALRNNVSGNNNTAIGINAGRNSTGSSNVFLGYESGMNETGNQKLFISNNSTNSPLIKGEFDNKNLKVNTGSTTSSTVGFLAVGNFDAAFTMPTSNSYRLIVQDGIITEKVKVALRTTADWADYVFDPTYKLMSLDKVEQFTKVNKHLPNVPSAEDMTNNGLDVGQTSKMFMEKIEELTLYMIELNKEVKALKLENEVLKTKLK